MIIEFLGTGAADWHIDRREQEPDFRRFSSALIDGTILIDPGPHIYDYITCENKPDLFRNVKAILLTHSHGDHYNITNLLRLHEETGCELFATPNVHYRAWGKPELMERLNAVPHCKIGAGDAFRVAGYNILALPANHNANNPHGEQCLHYIIEKDGKSLFYGLDGGWVTCHEWDEICRRRIDLFVFDGTVGYIKDDYRIGSHTGLYMVELLRDAINGLYRDSTPKIMISHLARTLHAPRAQTEEMLIPKGIIPAYDGDVVEI